MKLQKLQFIKRLAIDKATYRLADDKGGELELNVDYISNTYLLNNVTTLTDKQFISEVNRLAKGLLARKHGANLAHKEHYL